MMTEGQHFQYVCTGKWKIKRCLECRDAPWANSIALCHGCLAIVARKALELGEACEMYLTVLHLCIHWLFYLLFFLCRMDTNVGRGALRGWVSFPLYVLKCAEQHLRHRMSFATLCLLVRTALFLSALSFLGLGDLLILRLIFICSLFAAWCTSMGAAVTESNGMW